MGRDSSRKQLANWSRLRADDNPPTPEPGYCHITEVACEPSEHFIFSVDATGEAELELMQEQIEWLLSRGIIAPASAPDHTHRPYVQGPNIADVLKPISAAGMASDRQTPTGSVSAHHGRAVCASCETLPLLRAPDVAPTFSPDAESSITSSIDSRPRSNPPRPVTLAAITHPSATRSTSSSGTAATRDGSLSYAAERYLVSTKLSNCRTRSTVFDIARMVTSMFVARPIGTVPDARSSLLVGLSTLPDGRITVRSA